MVHLQRRKTMDKGKLPPISKINHIIYQRKNFIKMIIERKSKEKWFIIRNNKEMVKFLKIQ